MSPEQKNICRYRFLLGKGGTGKSTISVIKALYQAGKKRNVLLVSLDPAHNLHDIFRVKLGEKPKKIVSNLLAMEVDHQQWIRRYLTGVRREVNKSYRYLTALNLDSYFDILKFSPGIEEYALLLAFEEIIHRFKDNTSVIIFDMPPTALSLKFFRMPGLSLQWLDKLSALRSEIIGKRELITKIKIGKKEFETDKILISLKNQWKKYHTILELFRDRSTTSIEIVVNPEKLSIGESDDIIENFQEMKIPVGRVVLNKLRDARSQRELLKKYKLYKCESYFYSGNELLGIENLSRYYREFNG